MRSTRRCSLAASARKGLMRGQWYRWHAVCEDRRHEPAPEHLPLKADCTPHAAARAAGLRYGSDALPGIARRPARAGFRYVDADGTAVRDRSTLARIRALAIPPAW